MQNLYAGHWWIVTYCFILSVCVGLSVVKFNLRFDIPSVRDWDFILGMRSVKSKTNFISSGSKIVKRLRCRQYDPVIIERAIGIVLGSFTALYRSFLKRCILTNKAVGTIWRALSKPPQRRQGPDPRPLWLLVGTPLTFEPELAYSLRVTQLTLMNVPIYFWYTIILPYILYMFVYHLFMTSPLW